MIPFRRPRSRPLRRHSSPQQRPSSSSSFRASHIVALAVGFCSVWGLALWYAHASLDDVGAVHAKNNNNNSNNSNSNRHQGLVRIERSQPSSSSHQRQKQKQQWMDSTNESNPYFGWQPTILRPMQCSWRECFKKDHTCATCRDDIITWNGSGDTDRSQQQQQPPPPPPPPSWIPDVTMLARMRRSGFDANGDPWPPPLDRELCEPMGPQGGRQDVNKECTCTRRIRVMIEFAFVFVFACDCARVCVCYPSLFRCTQLVHLSMKLDVRIIVNHNNNNNNNKIIERKHTDIRYGTTKTVLDQVPIIAQQQSADGTTDDGDGPKIMCVLYTMESAHATTIRAIRETWASQCDGFLAFSTASDPRIPAISIPHDGPEEYGNMWQKVRSIWKFVGTHYVDRFDWFFQGGDDLFVMPQNLRNYLSALDADEDHFVGRRFKGYGRDNYFNSGGSGYALSRGLLRKYVATGWSHPKCNPDARTSMEDVMMAKCLREAFHVPLTDTRDGLGRERFHPFAPGTHLHWQPPGPGRPRDWYADYNREWPVQLGAACCAPDSVSFHYIKKPAMVRHIYALLYSCGGAAKK